jgi:hypothetical protein
MLIELSTLTFTDQDDIVPLSGVEQIFNSRITNTLAGNDIITGTGDYSNNIGFGARESLLNLGTLNTGEGNDIITGEGGFGYGIQTDTLNTGEGNDIITGSGSYDGISQFGGTFNTGEGNDEITGISRHNQGIYLRSGIFDTVDGNDRITGDGLGTGIYNESVTFTTGDGNDTIEGIGNSYGIYNKGVINTGNNNDSLISHGDFINYGEVFLGDGNDIITASIIAEVGLSNFALENYNAIETGDGNDTITSTGVIYNEGVINTGDGHDSIVVDGGFDGTGTGYGIYNNGGAIITGNGNDSIIANQGFESAMNSSGAWFLGEGEDYIKGFGSGDFYGGNGNDTLELTPGTYTVGIWGVGGESPIFTKGNQLMITSEFETLIAGGTTYDFASLTAGQIITVA